MKGSERNGKRGGVGPREEEWEKRGRERGMRCRYGSTIGK